MTELNQIGKKLYQTRTAIDCIKGDVESFLKNPIYKALIKEVSTYNKNKPEGMQDIFIGFQFGNKDKAMLHFFTGVSEENNIIEKQ